MYLTKIFVVTGIVISMVTACQGSEIPLQANAGEDFTVAVGTSPTFNGCASSGDIVNYKWTIVDAPQTMSDNEGKIIREVESNCMFTLDANMGVDEMGTWEVQLEVRDTADNTSTDTVQVEVVQ